MGCKIKLVIVRRKTFSAFWLALEWKGKNRISSDFRCWDQMMCHGFSGKLGQW